MIAADTTRLIAYGKSPKGVEVWIWWYVKADQFVITVRKPDGTISKNWLGRWVFDLPREGYADRGGDQGYDYREDGYHSVDSFIEPGPQDIGVRAFHKHGELIVQATILDNDKLTIRWNRISSPGLPGLSYIEEWGDADPMNLVTVSSVGV
jgi:hypothetical protein